MKETKKVVSILVFDKPHVLIKLIGFFEKRGYTVESINLIKTGEKEKVRYIFVLNTKEKSFEKHKNQLFRIVETLDVKFL